jgi:hypothetical protein
MKLQIYKFFQRMLLFLLMISLSSCLSHSVNTNYRNRANSESLSINIPNMYMDYFSEEKKDILIDYLSKSSAWHVFPFRGTTIAMKRENAKVCNPILESLPSSYPGGVISGLKNSFFNLSRDVYQPPEFDYPVNKLISNNVILLTMDPSYDSNERIVNPLMSSNLIIGSKDKKISLHVHEDSTDKQRESTKNYLIAVSNELKKLTNAIDTKKENIVDSILPLGSSILAPEQVISIKADTEGGSILYSVSGFINLGKKGFVYLKLLSKNSGNFIQPDQESTNAEYVGWSKNTDRKFNFCLGRRMRRNLTEKSFSLEVQLWFKPSDNSLEELIYKETFIEGPASLSH